MFITKFSTENWQGNQNNISLNPVRNWSEIEKAIKELEKEFKSYIK